MKNLLKLKVKLPVNKKKITKIVVNVVMLSATLILLYSFVFNGVKPWADSTQELVWCKSNQDKCHFAMQKDHELQNDIISYEAKKNNSYFKVMASDEAEKLFIEAK